MPGGITSVQTRRPADRREQILAAASALFIARGYHNVSAADVAAAVEITAPALYRHFRGKRELLYHVVAEGLGRLGATVTRAGDLEDVLTRLSAGTVERPGLSILWQREARHLPDGEREHLRRYLSQIAAQLAALIKLARPGLDEPDAELLAWAVLAVYGSLATHRVSLPRRRLVALLRHLGASAACCATAVTPPTQPPDQKPPDQKQAAQKPPDQKQAAGEARPVASRREQMLTEAIRLFDERGFQSVSTDDIGAAVGTSGPSVYKHFPAKTDLLVAAVTRAGERRDLGIAQALAAASGPQQALPALLRAYIGFALQHSHLIGLLISEREQLPEPDRRRARQVQRDHIALWVTLLGQARPGLDPAQARIRVYAALTVVHNAVRTSRLVQRPDLPGQLFRIGEALLLG
jgi:AcrR family transcriptional regulator